MMRSARSVAVGALVLLLAGATIAQAAGTLTVARRGPATVTYPEPVHLTVRWTEPVATPIDIQVRYAGGDWRTFRTISASRAAESTRPALIPLTKPPAAYEVRAVQGSLESSVATGAVRVKLHAYAAKGSYSSRESTITVRGSMMPTHTVGAAVSVKVWKVSVKRPPRGHGRPALVRELVGEYAGAVDRNSGGTSFIRAAIPMLPKGIYEARAYHEDAAHAPSASRAFSFRVR